MKAFADLYRRLDSATSTRAKQAAMVEAFSAARAAPAQWASAAWTVYFLAGGKPRQTVPTRTLWRLAVEGSGHPEWLCAECYGAVGDLAETLTLILPEGGAGEEVSLEAWMRERLLVIPSLDDEEKYARVKRWVGELPTDQRFAFFKLITGELRVGVSRLQVVKALSEVAGVEESRMAQRMIGYSQARRVPAAADFEALIGEVADAEARALDLGRPYPFYLAQSWQRPLADMGPALGSPADWVIEWKFDGIRAQLIRRGQGWRLWSRGEELISEAYPDLEPLARALPDHVALDGELVVMVSPAGETRPDSLAGLRPFASLQQRLGRKVVSEKTLKELPVAFIAYDLLEFEGRDVRAEPQGARRALLERLVGGLFEEAKGRGGLLPVRISPVIAADSWEELALVRDEARELGREGLMLKARAGAYGVGRRKGDDRTDVWWKWKLDPMSLDAVLIYAQRGHGRRSGVYSDYTFALWSGGEEEEGRELVPFAKAYSGLSDAEMREMDAIIRRTTVETFGPVRSVKPTQVIELGFEGIALSKRHRSGVAVRFPRMLRWRRDKPVAEADTLATLKALLPAGREG
ncbi:MAG: ATP-dependent DNA ligase [Hyphomicrobiales bacterium]|nr:ATP-dependent DNA ligase [Hyphomicrobiales bacterium]